MVGGYGKFSHTNIACGLYIYGLYMAIIKKNELLQSLELHTIHCKMLIVSVFARLLSFTWSQALDDLHTGEPSTTSLYNGPH